MEFKGWKKCEDGLREDGREVVEIAVNGTACDATRSVCMYVRYDAAMAMELSIGCGGVTCVADL